MHRLGYSMSTVQIIDSLLRNQQLRVKLRHKYSGYRELEPRVPQDAVLAPHLYSIYTYAVSKTARTVIEQFADDTAIREKSFQFDSAKRRLQKATNTIMDGCIKGS